MFKVLRLVTSSFCFRIGGFSKYRRLNHETRVTLALFRFSSGWRVRRRVWRTAFQGPKTTREKSSWLQGTLLTQSPDDASGGGGGKKGMCNWFGGSGIYDTTLLFGKFLNFTHTPIGKHP